MLGKVILWISGLVFVAYGVVCLVSPEVPAGYAGLSIDSGDGFAEIGAMYGGLQTGFGLFCALGATRPTYYRPALTLLVLGIGLLAVGRLVSTLVGEGTVGGYTWGAMAYEFATAILAGVALRRS